MRNRRFLAAAFALYACFPDPSRAQRLGSPLVENQEISIAADEMSYEQKSNTIVARGAVVITKGGTVLRADEVRIDQATHEADARGEVRLTDPEGTIVAETMHVNLDEETGVLTQAQIHQSRPMHYSLSGSRVEKGPGQTYQIENGKFTTCECSEGPPSWSISGRDLGVTVGGYGTLAGGTFKVLDVPIMYLPRATFPVQRERQSGFLLPRFGVSNTRGFQTLLPFYWAINKNQDATLALDAETGARIGAVGEYRYAWSREIHGFLDASYFNESFRGVAAGKPFEATIPRDRWSVMAEHEQPLLEASHLYADVFLVGDDLFLREINTYAFEHAHEVAIRTLPFTQTHLAAVQLWDRAALKVEGTYYQDLTGFQSHTLQRVPEVDFSAQTLLGRRVLGELTASAVDFQRSRDVDGLRLDIAPAATLALPLGRFAFGSVRAGLRETAYHLTDTRLLETGQELPQDRSRELLQLGAEIGTSLSKVYPISWFGLEKIKHTIEPIAEYKYIPAVSQSDLPFFDGIDRINQRNLLSYGVVNRFLGRFSSAAPSQGSGTSPEADHAQIRELGRLAVTQSVDLSREIDPLLPHRAPNHFSDIDVDGRINPSHVFSVGFHTTYDVANTNISAAQVGFSIEEPRPTGSSASTHRLDTRTSASISYRFLTQNLLQEIDDTIAVRLTDWAGFRYSSRYDVVANRFLDNYFGIRLTSTCDCWSLDLAVTDRTNPQEVGVQAQFTLTGLGSSLPAPRTRTAP
jgi:LPS-assembly protein